MSLLRQRLSSLGSRALRASGALLLAALLAVPAAAQSTGTVTGTVTEAGSLRPLANAQVFVDGTSVGGLTNARGQYLITNAPAGDLTLRVELLGYGGSSQSAVLTAGGSVTVDFQLRQTALQLDEIVVTGAGQATERRRLGNTIASIDMNSLQEAPVNTVSEILSGREPGVMGIASGGMTGEGSKIRIRGSASLSQSNEPVIYVDGVRIDAAGGWGPGVGAGGGGAPSRLDDINPESIERIEILKGAAAATLYGTQASNGVIQIFTKRGQSGAPRYNVSVEAGLISTPMDRVLPHAGFVTGQNASSRDVGVTGVQQRYGISVQPYEVFEVDLIPQLFSTGSMQTVSASVTGGTSAATYYVAGRYTGENGPYDGSPFAADGFRSADDKSRRAQFNANLEVFPVEDLRVRVTTSFVDMFTETVDNNNNIFGVLSSLINSRPERGKDTNLFGSPAFATTRENYLRRTEQNVQRFGGSLTASYALTESISLDGTFGIDFVNQRAARIIPFGWNVDEFTGSNVTGNRTASDRNNREMTLDIKANWNTGWGDKWTANSLFGFQGFLTQRNEQTGNGQQFAGPGLDVAGAGALQSVGESFFEETNVGVLAQTQVGYDDFLFVTVGGRLDQNSAFGTSAGAILYPKISASVIPSQFDGWDSELLSTFRLRGALGRSGLQPGAFDQFTTFAPLASANGAGVAPANLGNPGIKPEISTEWEMGTELGLFNDRASVEFTYWNRTGRDVLVARQFAPSGGFRSTQLDNIGEMKSWGLEIGAQFVAVTTPNFSANVFANGSFLREKITDLGGAPALKVGGSYPRYRQFTEEGYAPGSFFGPLLNNSVDLPLHLGDCQALSRAEALTYLSEPRNPSSLQPLVQNCGSPESLKNYLGKPMPDWQGSFGTDMTVFQNFTLRTLFEYRAGNYFIHNLDRAFRRSHPLIGRNIRPGAEAEATLLNPASSAEQRLAAAETWVRELAALSPYDGLNEIYAADWVRLRELSLTYRAPAGLSEKFGADNLSFTVSGRNLALWTKYVGRDPELNVTSRGDGGGLTNNFLDGTAGWGMPIPRRVTFAIRAGF